MLQTNTIVVTNNYATFNFYSSRDSKNVTEHLNLVRKNAIFNKFYRKFLMSRPPCQQLDIRYQSYHSNAIFFASSPKGFKSFSKRALWIGVYFECT